MNDSHDILLRGKKVRYRTMHTLKTVDKREKLFKYFTYLLKHAKIGNMFLEGYKRNTT